MYFKTRAGLTEADVEFIASSLADSESEQESIRQRASDQSSVTELLGDKRLFERSMTTPPLFLSVSPQLFYYIFVYRALEHRHLTDPDVVDYVAGICVEFRSSASLWQLASVRDGKTMYMVDLLGMMADLDRPRQYELRRYIGNVTLFLTGFFPDFFFRRTCEVSAPPLTYYESIARSQYETAAEESIEYDREAAPVLNLLAERFVDIRSSMNIFTDSYLHLHNPAKALDVIRRQAATLDEETFRQSLALR